MSFLLGLLFLTLSVLWGIFLVQRILGTKGVNLFFFGSLAGIILTGWITYLFALFFANIRISSPISTSLFFVLSILTGLAVFFGKQILQMLPLLKDLKYRWLIALIFLAFSTSLIVSTFQYDGQNQSFLIGEFVHSDFAHHIPLIRSFSLGENVPAEAPLFAGEPIRYHFLLYFFAGLLERAGLPIDLALNIPSIIGFAGLLIAIWCLTEVLFKKEKGVIGTGLIAVFLFLTSSSLLAFTSFSLPSPLTLTSLVETIFGATDFLAGGPYYNWDGTITNLFWNLTIFTNQRHFAFGIAFAVFIFSFLLTALQEKEIPLKTTGYRVIFLAVLMGLLFSFHGFVFVSFIFLIALLFPFMPQKKLVLVFLILAGIIALPQLLDLSPPTTEAAPIWFPGYALHNNLRLDTFIEYWTKNLGLKFLLLPILFLVVGGLARKVLLASMGIFLLANLVRFGPDIWTSHKFFNIWLIFVNIAVAYLVVKMLMKKRFFWIITGVIFIFLLTLSGLLELPPIFNNIRFEINDWQKDATALFIVKHTKPNDVFATGYNIYHPVTLTGRMIMLGWPYFSWGAGYPTNQREEITRQIFETEDTRIRCQAAYQYGVRYLVTGKIPEQNEPYNPDIVLLSETLHVAAEDDRYIIFDLQPTCKNIL